MLNASVSCRKAESIIAPYLTGLQARVKPEGIRIGSCTSTILSIELADCFIRSVPVLWSPCELDRTRRGTDQSPWTRGVCEIVLICLAEPFFPFCSIGCKRAGWKGHLSWAVGGREARFEDLAVSSIHCLSVVVYCTCMTCSLSASTI